MSGLDYDYYPDDYDYDYEEEDSEMNHVKVMKSCILELRGINFGLLMKHTNGRYNDYSIHLRDNQPCYGELRKYKETHPDECTQPDNVKPDDLHHPFPSGTPYIVGTRFHPTPSAKPCWNLVMETMFDPKNSPWRKGIGNPEFITDGDLKVGVVMRDTKIDPTVMVNLFNCVKSFSSAYTQNLQTMVDNGMTPNEAILVQMLNAFTDPFNSGSYSHPTDGYYVSQQFSVKKYIDGTPNDLSGGTFHDRTDYNRTLLQDVFHTPIKEGGFSWQDGIVESGLAKPGGWISSEWRSDITITDRIKMMREMISAAYEHEYSFGRKEAA